MWRWWGIRGIFSGREMRKRLNQPGEKGVNDRTKMDGEIRWKKRVRHLIFWLGGRKRMSKPLYKYCYLGNRSVWQRWSLETEKRGHERDHFRWFKYHGARRCVGLGIWKRKIENNSIEHSITHLWGWRNRPFDLAFGLMYSLGFNIIFF